MYAVASAEPYPFWFINLAASRVKDMLWLRFEQRMIPTNSPSLPQLLGDSEAQDGGTGPLSDTQARR